MLGIILAAISLIHTPAAPTFLGCHYQPGIVWQNLSGVGIPVDPNSAAYIKATVDAGGGGPMHVFVPTDEKINMATNATPLVTVDPEVTWHSPYTPWPWDPSFYISPLSDHHAMVMQTDTCQYFEGYDTTWDGTALHQYNGGVWALRDAYVRPLNGSISSASGIPIGFLAVRPEELTAGYIDHALGWDAVAHTVSQTACVNPAGIQDCTDDLPYSGPQSDNPMPYGAHIRLKPSFNITNFPAEAQVVARALKSQGAYLYDTASENTIPFIDDVNGSPTWTAQDEAAIETISISNFDVVVPPQ